MSPSVRPSNSHQRLQTPSWSRSPTHPRPKYFGRRSRAADTPAQPRPPAAGPAGSPNGPPFRPSFAAAKILMPSPAFCHSVRCQGCPWRRRATAPGQPAGRLSGQTCESAQACLSARGPGPARLAASNTGSDTGRPNLNSKLAAPFDCGARPADPPVGGVGMDRVRRAAAERPCHDHAARGTAVARYEAIDSEKRRFGSP